MTERTDEVRARFDAAEDIAPDPSIEAGAPPPPDDPQGEGEDPPLKRAAALPLNDFGNGQRLVIHYGRDLMFVPRVGWFVWTGQVWKHDQDELIVRGFAQGIAPLIERETTYIEPTPREQKMIGERFNLRAELKGLEALAKHDEAQVKRIGEIDARLKAIDAQLKDHQSLIGRRLTHAKNAGNNGPLKNMLTESQTSLAVAREDLDALPLDINTESGVLRFMVTDPGPDEGAGRVAEVVEVPHDRDQRLTKMVPLVYDPSARAPRFEAFLEEIQPEPEMREFLKRWLGLSMSALKVQRFAFFYGNGANGKSVLVDTVARILDSYSASAKIESLTGSARRGGSDATPDLMLLVGARFVRTSEPDEGQRLQEGLIKELTGGEPMQVRKLHGDFFEFDPYFKLTMSGNHKPDIRGTDAGIWRRVMLVPFGVQIPEDKRDQALGEKLWEERAGIFNWLVEGLLDYLEGGLRPPAGVTEATQEYRAESDPIGTFLTGCCDVTGDPQHSIPARRLGEAFNYFLMEQNLSVWKPTTFSRQVAERSRHWQHPETGKRFEKAKASISKYIGIRLDAAFETRFEGAHRDSQNRIIGLGDGTPVKSTPDPECDF